MIKSHNEMTNRHNMKINPHNEITNWHTIMINTHKEMTSPYKVMIIWHNETMSWIYKRRLGHIRQLWRSTHLQIVDAFNVLHWRRKVLNTGGPNIGTDRFIGVWGYGGGGWGGEHEGPQSISILWGQASPAPRPRSYSYEIQGQFPLVKVYEA